MSTATLPRLFRTLACAALATVMALPAGAQNATHGHRTLGINSAAAQGDSVQSPMAAPAAPTCWNGASDYPTCTPSAVLPGSGAQPSGGDGSTYSSMAQPAPARTPSPAPSVAPGQPQAPAANANTMSSLPESGAATVEPCFNGAKNPPECTDMSTAAPPLPTRITHCANGGDDYPTCTPPTCANGAGDYPICTEQKCANGALDYPTCTPGVCINGAIDYPTCMVPGCRNGAQDYPTCTTPQCANGANDYPTCTDPNEVVTEACETGHLVSRKGPDRIIVAVLWGYPACAATAQRN